MEYRLFQLLIFEPKCSKDPSPAEKQYYWLTRWVNHIAKICIVKIYLQEIWWNSGSVGYGISKLERHLTRTLKHKLL